MLKIGFIGLGIMGKPACLDRLNPNSVIGLGSG